MKPLEVEILVAELGRRRGDDQLYHIVYDGTVVDEETLRRSSAARPRRSPPGSSRPWRPAWTSTTALEAAWRPGGSGPDPRRRRPRGRRAREAAGVGRSGGSSGPSSAPSSAPERDPDGPRPAPAWSAPGGGLPAPGASSSKVAVDGVARAGSPERGRGRPAGTSDVDLGRERVRAARTGPRIVAAMPSARSRPTTRWPATEPTTVVR